MRGGTREAVHGGPHRAGLDGQRAARVPVSARIGETGRGAAITLGLASALTAVVAWPVLRAPTRQIFGAEIVGRHHDPFTVMYQMAGTGPPMPYVQPVTDVVGWLLARALDPVAAYNVVILATFPLTAAATYLLARYVRLPHFAALAAALFFAFAPVHVAHAAYHPHIAQVQWLPLYLLALFAMVDRPSPWRALGLAGAIAALALSSFYLGLIGMVVTPVALAGYWWASPRGPHPMAALWQTAAVLAAVGTAGLALAAMAVPEVLRDASAYAFQSAEVPLYSARWWAYFTPSVTHPVMGPAAAGTFARAGITFELVEQQIYLGLALLALAALAGAGAVLGWQTPPDRRPVILWWALAATAALVSIGPVTGACTAGSWAPACQVYAVAPMFRAYARFAIVTHLAMALAAGAGMALLARRSRRGRLAAAALVAVAALEYVPLPAPARDVLPTEGHRWLATSGTPDWRTLDCVRLQPALGRVPWLMRQGMDFLGPVIGTCRDPELGARLAALGHTHVLVRGPDRADTLPFLEISAAGMARVASFPDSDVYAVMGPPPDVLTIRDEGFFDYEYDAVRQSARRWMGTRGHLRVRNTTRETRHVMLSMDLESGGWPRRLDVSLDSRPAGSLDIGTGPRSYALGPWPLAPGNHDVVLAATGAPFRPAAHGASVDGRELAVMVRRHTWIAMDGGPDVP